ncbi:phage tail protein, partial [Clostridium beijerinckii]
MAEKFYSILTNIGKAKIANSIGLGIKVNFVKMKVGDGGGNYYEPTEDQLDLKNTVWEGNINHVEIDKDNPNWIHIEVMIPSTIGGFTIREYGAFDEEGNMLGICKCAETYKPVIADGSTKELLLNLILVVTNTESITLKIDPTIIFAKKSDIEELRTYITAQLSDMVYQTAGGSATAITLTIKGTLINGYPITFIASVNNGGAA